MQKAIENVNAGFERMPKIWSKAVNIAAIQQATGQMNQMSAVMNKARHDITQTTKYGIFNCQLTKFEKSFGFIQYHCKTKAHLDFMNGGMQTIDGLQKKVMNSVNRSCLP